jgi:two-component system, NtrC family, response regulator AtoC
MLFPCGSAHSLRRNPRLKATKDSLILLVDDEPSLRELLLEDLPEQGFSIMACENLTKARELLEKHPVEAVLLDYHLPDGTGRDFFQSIKEELSVPVIFITSHPDVEQAVLLMKEGAADYILKPFSIQDVVERLNRALEVQKLRAEVRYHRSQQCSRHTLSHALVGKSPGILAAVRATEEVARAPLTPVLITGETGTGKEVIARQIHQKTHGESQPFVEVDCTTIPRPLFESELFGHEKGAFTGADRTKEGIFELGKEGTIFLDEIGEIDVELQSRLLRVLETRQFRRVGGTRLLELKARVIAATNRDLTQLIAEQKFRSDLYYRLAVYQIHLPPLRSRKEDIETLALHFLKEAAPRLGKSINRFSESFLKRLREHSFPGNVRELRNMVEQAVIQSTGPEADCSREIHFGSTEGATDQHMVSHGAQHHNSNGNGDHSSNSPPTLEAQERAAIEAALKTHQGNKSAAARQLGISRAAFLRRLEKFRMTG